MLGGGAFAKLFLSLRLASSRQIMKAQKQEQKLAEEIVGDVGAMSLDDVGRESLDRDGTASVVGRSQRLSILPLSYVRMPPHT